MAKSYFSRSNVNEESLQISKPGRSSFDFYHDHSTCLPMGQFIPVDVLPLMPSGIVSGNVIPEFALDTVGTPQIGPTRLDSHVIAVSARRINKDWRQLIEGRVDLIPQTNIALLFGRIAKTFFKLSNDTSTFRQVIQAINKGVNRYDVMPLHEAFNNYMDVFFEDPGADTGYMLDRFVILRNRENQYLTNLVAGTSPYGVVTAEDLMNYIYYVMQPMFGEGSILDNLKYPIFSYYGSAMNAFRAAIENDQDLPSVGNLPNDWSDLFAVVNYTGTRLQSADMGSFVVNEMPLRASYAAWYDNLRNWHLEERDQLPDPDTWGSNSIFAGVVPVELVFLLPRYRTYGNDAFTTIQTDAAWRHVFAPIYDDGFSEMSFEVSESSPTETGDFNRIYDVMIQGVHRVFPQGVFKRTSSDSNYFTAYLADLQNMKRSGMLQNYLAREYYYPDTYAGQLYAHWQIEANDLVGVSSQYVGGSEQFISGEQKVNATGTDDTPAGTRTFVGGASTSANVLYSAGGDFVYLVTFVSLQPIPCYDAKDMHLSELSRADLPFPEFANDTRVEIRTQDMLRGFEYYSDSIGFVPRFLQYRSILDSAHADFLRDKRSYLWLRDAYATNDFSAVNPQGQPMAINAYSLHVHPALDAWLNKSVWDNIAYGKITFTYAVDFPLPAAIDFF